MRAEIFEEEIKDGLSAVIKALSMAAANQEQLLVNNTLIYKREDFEDLNKAVKPKIYSNPEPIIVNLRFNPQGEYLATVNTARQLIGTCITINGEVRYFDACWQPEDNAYSIDLSC